MDSSRAPFVRCVGPLNIAVSFEAPEQLVHGLLTHGGTLGESSRANPIRPRKLEHSHMREPQLREAGSVELADDSAMDRLGGNPQQCADEHVLSVDW
jgi:hypothetical protein